MNNSLKVFLSCALGAFTGSLVALQFNRNYWWLGLIAGFLVGYLSIEVKTVISAIPESWNRARVRLNNNEIVKTVPHVRTLWLCQSCLGAIGCTMVFVAARVKFLHHYSVDGFSLASILRAWGMFTTWSGAFLGVTYSLIDHRPDALKLLKRMYIGVIPAVLPFTILYILMYWVPVQLFKLAKKWWRPMFGFSQHLLILIHSDLRLLCGTDAAIGASVGYFFHNALLSALAGGILGLLNYEVVSKRILHLDVRITS